MACKDCYNGCDDTISDQCVKYTGPDSELLGICTGDPLSKLEEEIIDRITTLLDGTGMTLADVNFTNAPWLAQQFSGQNKTVSNLIQLLINSSQTLKSLIDALGSTAVSFNTSCLTGLPANPTRDQIVQVLLYNLCDLKEIVDGFQSNYVQQSDLNSLVLNIINSNNAGAVKYKDRMVPYSPILYEGPLSNFDSTGKGLASVGYEKIYLCNGLNGTKDYRGRAVVGAVKNVPGGTLDAAVNPSSSANSPAPVNYGVGEKFGENFHKQTVAELAVHNHPVVDPGHNHGIATSKDDSNGGGKASVGNSTPEGNLSTASNQTGIAVGSSGSGNAFNVRQPSIAVNFIIYIP